MDGAHQSDGNGYRVLARKYRPTNFDDLIGQEPMVRTLSNAFEAGRIAQAWMLTGVRGVGKTTTARILARALNYEIPGKVEQPTIHMPEMGSHCQAIMEGRHVDVIEMDAASHTGIGDIREIIEAARYKPVSTRYKVYIIDEVHMLSTAAFNGLLKTLEEPPAHVKFVFATTEIRKVPVTVLSRCQRFDLRRIDAVMLVDFLKKIAGLEEVGVEADALSMIARAAEGSVRDALSLLDQAIAHGAATVTGESVRAMLGLADRARVTDLFECVMRGDVATALDIVKEQYDVGAEPAIILSDLAEFTHLVTKFKISPDYQGGQAVTELERARGRDFAKSLSMRVLSRTWQILLKGVGEVQAAPRPLPAADMVLVRLCYAADLPTPDEVARQVRDGPKDAPDGAHAVPASSAEPTGASAGTAATTPAASDAPLQAPGDEPTAMTLSAPNVVAAAFGQTSGSAQRKPVVLPEPDPLPEPDALPEPRALPEAHSRKPAVLDSQGEPGPSAPHPDGFTDGEKDPGHGKAVNDQPCAPPMDIASLRDIADLLGEQRDLKLKFAVERQIRPVSMQSGKLEISVEPGAPPDLAHGLGRFLQDQTGQRWMVVVSRETGGRTLHEIDRADQARVLSDAAAHPDVAALLKAFPGAKIVDVRISPGEESPPETDAGLPGLDDPDLDDPGRDLPGLDD